jgi:predicted membrane-bound spermidine synthase
MPARPFPAPLLFLVFILSGVSAMVYQMTWQRSLLLLYGSNAESVAMVVAAFLVGLGLGSLVGGALSQRTGIPLVVLFAAAELLIGSYGLVSLHLFSWIGALTVGSGMLMTGVLAFSLVLVPTLLMGATLPLLVAHQVGATGDAGRSVSDLYFVNTLGAGVGAIFTSSMLLGKLGLHGTVTLAAALNVTAALVILLAWTRSRRAVV